MVGLRVRMEVVRLRTPGVLAVTMLAIVSGVMCAQQLGVTGAVTKRRSRGDAVRGNAFVQAV